MIGTWRGAFSGAVLMVFISGSAFAAPEQSTGHPVDHAVEYKQGDTALEGYVAYPKEVKPAKGKVPAVILVHDWMGMGDYVKKRARMVADLGYVAFAADIYGKGVQAKNTDEAAKLATHYKDDRPLLRSRIRAAYDTVTHMDGVDPSRIVVLGYCFGGTTALELARSGAPLVGTISFHGGLSTPTPGDAKNIHGRVLALHGGDDPLVPPKEVEAFEDEMRKGGVDWELVAFGGAVHAFTVWNIPYKPGSPVGYNEKADKRSWNLMEEFLAEVFGKKKA